MRRALVAFALTLALGLVAVLAFGLLKENDLAFTLDVQPNILAADLGPTSTVCQRPVQVREPFTSIEFFVGTYEQPGSRLIFTVRDETREPLGRGVLAAGYPDGSRPTVNVGRIGAGQRVAVCVRNDGSRRVALFGGSGAAAPGSAAFLDGESTETDVYLRFLEERPTSLLALVPQMIERASVFKPGWVGEWTYWALMALVMIGVPVALGLSIVATRESS